MTPTKGQIQQEAEKRFPISDGKEASKNYAMLDLQESFIEACEWALSQPSDAMEFAVWLSLNTDNQDSAGSYLKETYYLYSELYQIFLKEKQK